MKKLASFKDIHRGETIIVCGCGSSLNELTNSERFITIGVNDVGRRFHPNYLVVVNPRKQFKGDRFNYVRDSQAKFLFTQLDIGHVRPEVVRFRLGRRGGTDFANPNVLHFTQNSPYVALCLAVHMGAKRIGLIGVDFTVNHFFASTGTHPLTRQISRINQQYSKLAEALNQKDIKIVNLSRESSLTAFPKIGIEEFISLKNDPSREFQQPDKTAAEIVHKEEIQAKKIEKGQRMKIVIEKHRPGIIEDLMFSLAKTAGRIGYQVTRGRYRMVNNPSGISVVWNGRRHRAAGPVLYCEHGWLPRWHYQISHRGINADSHVAPFRWDKKPISAEQAESLDKYLQMIREKGPATHSYMQTEREAVSDLPGEFILVPLQIEGDTNIVRHVPAKFRKMQAFIDYISGFNLPYPVIYKQHPADQRHRNRHLYLRVRRKMDLLRRHGNTNIHQILKSGRCKGIISLNSNVVHDGLLWDVPAIVLGKNIWPAEDGPFLTYIPKDWKTFESHFSNDDTRKYRDAYIYYLMNKQWSLTDVQDEEKVARLIQSAEHTN